MQRKVCLRADLPTEEVGYLYWCSQQCRQSSSRSFNLFLSFNPDEMLGQLKPAYLALIIGLCLVEEMSLSWTNTVMMVQAWPSISAYHVARDSGSDWIRKITILMLALAGAASGKSQVVLTMVGILCSCAVLLANLGSRTWYFFQWQPLSYNGPLSSTLSYMTAVVTGFALPFLGHRTASVGGKPAIESILRLALLLSLSFVITDFDSVQKFIIVGKEVTNAFLFSRSGSIVVHAGTFNFLFCLVFVEQGCNQVAVNSFVGVWFSVSLVASMLIAGNVEPIRDYPDEEPLLEEDHNSPVGYRVPNLPDFPVDPSLAKRGIRRLSLRIELSVGMFLAAVIGAGIVALAFTGWGQTTEIGIVKTFDFF